MIGGIKVKVCGLTSAGDAMAAVATGADHLGFNFYPKSPRGISVEHYLGLAPGLPRTKKVAVCVEPTPVELARFLDAGFDFVQVHFNAAEPPSHLAAWSRAVGAKRLWLAPKLPPGTGLKAEWLRLADTILLDAFDAGKFGGTGRTGDWEMFRQLQAAHPDRAWILAGGLNPENVAAAVAATGARWIDVNSGVESSPGVKDHAKLSALKAALDRARTDHP